MPESYPVIVEEDPGKFAGLDISTALKRARECLDSRQLEIVFRVTGGDSPADIAAALGMSEQEATAKIEEAKVQVAHYHIQQWTPPTVQKQMVITRLATNGLGKRRRH